jgi:hypothetical protein
VRFFCYLSPAFSTIDPWPYNSSCIRYIFSAGASILALPLIQRIGVAGANALAAGLAWIGFGLLLLIIHRGPQMRAFLDEREAAARKLEEEETRKEESEAESVVAAATALAAAAESSDAKKEEKEPPDLEKGMTGKDA